MKPKCDICGNVPLLFRTCCGIIQRLLPCPTRRKWWRSARSRSKHNSLLLCALCLLYDKLLTNSKPCSVFGWNVWKKQKPPVMVMKARHFSRSLHFNVSIYHILIGSNSNNVVNGNLLIFVRFLFIKCWLKPKASQNASHHHTENQLIHSERNENNCLTQSLEVDSWLRQVCLVK